MALRDKLRDRVQPFLEPGEQVQAVFMAQTGPNPYLGLLTTLVFFWTKHHVFAVTDRRILVLSAGAFSPSKPKAVLTSLPRTTVLGPLSGLWGTMELDGTKYFVNKRFHKDVEEADGLRGTSAPATA